MKLSDVILILGGVSVWQKDAGIAPLGAQRGLKSLTPKLNAFVCTRTISVSVPSLHEQFTDSETRVK